MDMNRKQEMKARAPRVARSFMVRINDNPSAEHPQWNIVMAKDVSASGILFNYDHYLEPDSLVQFKLSLPGCGTIECDGVVVRNEVGSTEVMNRTMPAVCGVAANFHEISEEDQKAMQMFFMQAAAAGIITKEVPQAEDLDDGKSERAPRAPRQYITFVRRDESEPWQNVAILNISESGVLFSCAGKWTPGEILQLRMALPFVASQVFCKVKVARIEDRTREHALSKMYGIGASFIGLDETVRAKLRTIKGS